MDFTKLTPDKQVVDILIEMIEFHGFEKCQAAFDNYVKATDHIYHDTGFDLSDYTPRKLALELSTLRNWMKITILTMIRQ